ncbi:MAG: type III pantothenate kinase [Gammaproteobacteria bacterium]|nr:type III pantothenate kinase [Gammaproteobacteria bacterium]
MILLLDAGNSRLKWAVLRDGHYEYGGVLVHGTVAIKELASAAWSSLDPPEAVLVANVAGDALRRALNSWAKRHWKLMPDYLSATGEEFGIRNAYSDPARLGIDRWLGLLAARELLEGPLCIIDCGTALTIDVLSQDNRHLGGLIIPGIQLMREALTARAPTIREQIDQPASNQIALLGTDTGSAVVGGTVYAAVAVIDRVLSDLQADVGGQLHCVLTGGDVPLLLPLLGGRVQHEPDLVLQGLARLARARLTAQSMVQPGTAAPAAEDTLQS